MSGGTLKFTLNSGVTMSNILIASGGTANLTNGTAVNGSDVNFAITGTPPVDSTFTILDASQVTLVHMETLRRATLYAGKDAQAAKQLLLMVTARAEAVQNSGHPDALAVFDAGYLAETYKQWLGEGGQNPANGTDGYGLVKKALRFRGKDGQMEFAAALVTLPGPARENQEHAQRAMDGAKTDALLARNLNTRFLGAGSQTMAEMIQRNATTKVARE